MRRHRASSDCSNCALARRFCIPKTLVMTIILRFGWMEINTLRRTGDGVSHPHARAAVICQKESTFVWRWQRHFRCIIREAYGGQRLCVPAHSQDNLVEFKSRKGPDGSTKTNKKTPRIFDQWGLRRPSMTPGAVVRSRRQKVQLP